MFTRTTLFAAMLLASAPLLAQTADGTTARGPLKTAVSTAQKWQSDAVLTSVHARTTTDGKARKWAYMFYSAKTRKAYSVDLDGAKVIDTMEVRPHITDPVVADFIDSDQAINVARANGVDTKGDPIVMSLLVMGQATKFPASTWTVGGSFKPGAVAVMVDARTGKFLFRQAVPQ